MVDDTEDCPGADRQFVVRDLIHSLDRGDARTRAMIAAWIQEQGRPNRLQARPSGVETVDSILPAGGS
jgi:hypothetical protein